MNEDQLNKITVRLDIIIKILSIRFTEEGNQMEQVKKLLLVGMTPSEIAKLLGKPTNLITAYSSKINKRKAAKK